MAYNLHDGIPKTECIICPFLVPLKDVTYWIEDISFPSPKRLSMLHLSGISHLKSSAANQNSMEISGITCKAWWFSTSLLKSFKNWFNSDWKPKEPATYCATVEGSESIKMFLTKLTILFATQVPRKIEPLASPNRYQDKSRWSLNQSITGRYVLPSLLYDMCHPTCEDTILDRASLPCCCWSAPKFNLYY